LVKVRGQLLARGETLERASSCGAFGRPGLESEQRANTYPAAFRIGCCEVLDARSRCQIPRRSARDVKVIVELLTPVFFLQKQVFRLINIELAASRLQLLGEILLLICCK
jgi:hypothetical protein